MNTTDYNNPAWLARNCEESDPFEMACRVQIERLMVSNAELEQRLQAAKATLEMTAKAGAAHARHAADLEAQLESIGAGGVGPLMPVHTGDADRPTAWLITDRAGRLGGGEWITRSELDIKEALEEGCQIEPLWAEQRSAQWVGLTDEDRQAVFESLPDALDGFLKLWGWPHFAKAIEIKVREKNGWQQ